MKRITYIARVLVIVVPLAALVPLGRVAYDWLELSRMLPGGTLPSSSKGFDWVLWQDVEGVIEATYVFPNGPAAARGVQTGDVFYSLDYQQYFNADDIKRAIEGIPPGETRLYQLLRDGRFMEVPVTLTRYPTFIYPLSTAIWQFSLWSFTLGAFLHIVGLIIAAPLALRSRKARYSLMLIALSSLWVFGNLLRLMLIEFVGPPLVHGGAYDQFFQFLTLVGIAGWIGFPSLLLQHLIAESVGGRPRVIGPHRHLLHLPALLLTAAVSYVIVHGSLGPLTIDALVSPTLFYACTYIAFTAVLILILHRLFPEEARAALGDWGATGSIVTLLVAFFFGLSLVGVVPLFGAATDVYAGWLIVGAQLLSVVPVVLVSVATLKHGKIDQVLSRALTYITVIGLFFFMFVGGLAVIDTIGIQPRLSRNVVAGVFAIALLLVFDRAARQIRVYAANFFTSERQQIRKQLGLFQEQIRSILSLEVLINRTVSVVGELFETRSAVLYLTSDGSPNRWLSATYHPEPPYLTERVVSMIWPHIQVAGDIWALNPELNESQLTPELSAILKERGAALAIPIAGDRLPVGVLVLGQRRHRRMVYNLDDVEMLRSLCAQLAIAVERLRLVEREKDLIRESAEAHLVALRAQINPHFLFNALNTIAALIEERPEEAEETLEHLASIFRYTLQTGSRAFVSLREEFGLVQHYLAVEQVRFGAKLVVDVDLPTDLQDEQVPAFAVQTLVENAIKHGLSKRREGGSVRIRAVAAAGGVEVVVEDTGVGIPELFARDAAHASSTTFYGIGLRNISSRLEKLYHEPDLLRISSSDGTG
ncbi:MAG: histidine kinase, partial [Rhodothermales bacterium]